MGSETDRFVRALTSKRRVLLLGGLAVIAHGLSRKTLDTDIWLDPGESAEEWAAFLEEHCRDFHGLSLHRLPGWQRVEGRDIAEAVEPTGMIRIMGLELPFDVFRRPNEIKMDTFDTVYQRGIEKEDGARLPHPLDLIESKLNTDRDKDQRDIDFLESLVRSDYRKKLPTADPDEARAMLDRYSEWQVLKAALLNPHPEVKALANQHLREFAEAGDPFSQAILAGREIP